MRYWVMTSEFITTQPEQARQLAGYAHTHAPESGAFFMALPKSGPIEENPFVVLARDHPEWAMFSRSDIAGILRVSRRGAGRKIASMVKRGVLREYAPEQQVAA